MKLMRSYLLIAVVTCVLSSMAAFATPPPRPTNVRTIVLPAEVLLVWDGSVEVDHYKIYGAGPDRRWRTLATNVSGTTYRDTDFAEMPYYYQIAAINAAGESAATA